MTNSEERRNGRPRVLVLGGGFAGIGAARSLKDADVDVVLVDKHNYHTFQPLLYQLATALLETEAVGHSLRDLFHEQPNVTVHEATVTSVDLPGREVRFTEIDPLSYDYLVVGLGAEVNFFGVTGTGDHAFPMYTLANALELRRRVVEMWEAVDRDRSLAEDGGLSIVIVGGGPTGVESAGALAELYSGNLTKDFPDLPHEQARLTLVEASPELFSMFKKNLRTYTKKALEDRGVEVLLGEVVESVTPTRVTLKSGKVLKAHTLVWGAGLQGSPIAGTLGIELQRGNRVAVEPDLSVPGYSDVFAVGDIAAITETKSGEVLPQLGSVALQAGEHAGKNIGLLTKGKPTEPFEYKDKGTMATIGRGSAVVQFRSGRTMKGKTASLAWGTVHLALLSTGEDRAKAVVDWVWAGFTHERSGRIDVRLEDE